MKQQTLELRRGYANVVGHHGEMLQGCFLHEGRYERGLITMPCRRYVTTSSFIPGDTDDIQVFPSFKKKALKAAQLFMTRFGEGIVGGKLILHSNVPVKRGLGSSTQDIIAAVLAVGDSLGLMATKAEVTALTVEIETASDPLLYKSAVLFAQRKAEIIEDYARPLPHFSVVGFSTDREGVDTLSMPLPQYSLAELERFCQLRDMMKKGILQQDHELVAEAATTSAIINQRYQPKPNLEKIIQIVRSCGGLGIQISHSGSVVGCLFRPSNYNERVLDLLCNKLSRWIYTICHHSNKRDGK